MCRLSRSVPDCCAQMITLHPRGGCSSAAPVSSLQSALAPSQRSVRSTEGVGGFGAVRPSCSVSALLGPQGGTPCAVCHAAEQRVPVRGGCLLGSWPHPALGKGAKNGFFPLGNGCSTVFVNFLPPQQEAVQPPTLLLPPFPAIPPVSPFPSQEAPASLSCRDRPASGRGPAWWALGHVVPATNGHERGKRKGQTCLCSDPS